MFAKVDKTKTAFAVEFQKAIAQQPTWLAPLAPCQA